jgi:hypothetical protein
VLHSFKSIISVACGSSPSEPLAFSSDSTEQQQVNKPQVDSLK